MLIAPVPLQSLPGWLCRLWKPAGKEGGGQLHQGMWGFLGCPSFLLGQGSGSAAVSALAPPQSRGSRCSGEQPAGGQCSWTLDWCRKGSLLWELAGCCCSGSHRVTLWVMEGHATDSLPKGRVEWANEASWALSHLPPRLLAHHVRLCGGRYIRPSVQDTSLARPPCPAPAGNAGPSMTVTAVVLAAALPWKRLEATGPALPGTLLLSCPCWSSPLCWGHSCPDQQPQPGRASSPFLAC